LRIVDRKDMTDEAYHDPDCKCQIPVR
jgi:hypothetical protein